MANMAHMELKKEYKKKEVVWIQCVHIYVGSQWLEPMMTDCFKQGLKIVSKSVASCHTAKQNRNALENMYNTVDTIHVIALYRYNVRLV